MALRRSLVLILLLAIPALALAGCTSIPQTPTSYTASTRYEGDELDRNALAGEGQHNCVLEARGARGTDRCVLELTGAPSPLQGIRTLDNFYGSVGPGSPQEDATNPITYLLGGDVGPTSIVTSPSFLNWHRVTQGSLPDFIAPGVGGFVSVLGYWYDLDADGDVEYHMGPGGTPSPLNEWVGINGRPIYSYVEPASHPAVMSVARPADDEPDVRYDRGNRGVYQNIGGTLEVHSIVMTDGSLLQTMRVVTVSDAILLPGDDGRFPFTSTAESLVDVDRYVAVVAPLEGPYGTTLAPIVNAIGSPSIGLCPNTCYVDPIRIEGLEAVTGPAASLWWGKYESELNEDSGSTAAGRKAEFVSEYRAWADLLGRSSYVPGPPIVAHDGALTGRAADGRQTVAPGYVGWEAWTGIWKDINGDGWVGVASQPDPHEGGARPLADDYWHSRGEFFGIAAKHWKIPTLTNLSVVLTPDAESWGVLRAYETLFLVPLPTEQSERCDVVNNYLNGCITADLTGPIRMELARHTTEGRVGYYATTSSLIMPLGSPGFTACLEDTRIEYMRDVPTVELVRDCDYYPPWGPL